ncbi:hypothetical protein QTO34_015928 [Cnephaeus nilssonii]|uniref:Uncharacterized protein n=1 Tax=Cnephaeus nilssonii TaxID=3371016 RepID=A0AA40LTB1_CNENI|nr:hypothetical protein QTO34_015928 [Eptesicus nilssonii]
MYLKTNNWHNVALQPKEAGVIERKCLKTNVPLKLKEGSGIDRIYLKNSHQQKFAQLYILDTAKAMSKRLAMPENQGCSERLMININNLMHAINEVTKSYKMLHEVEKEANLKQLQKTEVQLAQNKTILYNKEVICKLTLMLSQRRWGSHNERSAGT